MLTSADDITLGATYKDIVSGTSGVAVYTMKCLTGCDRVGLETQGDDPKRIECDVTQLDYQDVGVSARFAKPANEEVRPGGPSSRSNRGTSRLS